MRIAKVKAVKTPERGTAGSAGLDFFIPEEFRTTEIWPTKDILIESGIYVEVPRGYALVAVNKSGVATKKNLQVGACLIDEDYQGEILIHLTNIGESSAFIHANEKIVQFICVPVNYVDIEIIDTVEKLYTKQTQRGSGGFGSTDLK